jgi:GT2 family glycosyltransferase
MEVDVIILSYTKNDEYYDMTKKCIESILNSEEEHTFNIIVMESDKTGNYIYDYGEVKTIVPNEEFNYNRFLNIGLEHCNNEWILISNNDTEYHSKWFSQMYKEWEKDNELLSMSPFCPIWEKHKGFTGGESVFPGYRVTYEITGWSILMNKKVVEVMGKFDEDFVFSYQDDDYSMTLQKHNIKHALIRNSVVIHRVSKSHDLVDHVKKFSMTHGQANTFFNKWKELNPLEYFRSRR